MRQRRLYMPKCAVVHGDAWQIMGITWISPNPQRDLGVTQVRGDVRTHQVKSEVQGDAGYNMSMWMKAPCVSQGYMGVHGSGSTSSSTWSRHVLQAETALHAHFSYHAWRCMESSWRSSQQWGLRVAQITGACDHIRFRARCRAKQGMHV